MPGGGRSASSRPAEPPTAPPDNGSGSCRCTPGGGGSKTRPASMRPVAPGCGGSGGGGSRWPSPAREASGVAGMGRRVRPGGGGKGSGSGGGGGAARGAGGGVRARGAGGGVRARGARLPIGGGVLARGCCHAAGGESALGRRSGLRLRARMGSGGARPPLRTGSRSPLRLKAGEGALP
jgi:hypothetical protein